MGLALLGVALAPACVTSDAGYKARGRGIVIGSVEIVLARPSRSIFDGFLEDNLSVLPMTYAFQFGHEARPWTAAPIEVSTEGNVRAFSVSLKPGRNVVENLELKLYDGPQGSWLGFLSPLHGREFKLALEFPVEPNQITYIGRIRVKLPTNLKLFENRYKLTVEDKATEDYAELAELLENVQLPVRKAIAARIP